MTNSPTATNPRVAAGLPPISPSVPTYLSSAALAHVFHLPDSSAISSTSAAAAAVTSSPLPGPQQVALPSAWNPKDKCGMLKLPLPLRVEYDGPGRSDNDAAAVRANYPIPLSTGIYYFECEIIAKGREGYIGIGFCAQGVPLNRLPGWEPLSWGYHGDDGNIFQSSGSGKPYGPTFQTGDVVGCGINFIDRSAFFTKNGVHLGTAFTNLPFPTSMPSSTATSSSSLPIVTQKPIYPSIGMRTPGEILLANFGHRAFRFDIDSYVRDERRKVWDKITLSSSHPRVQPDDLVKLVQGYLVHHGFKKTAEALMRQHQGRHSKSDVDPAGDAMDVDQEQPSPTKTNKRRADSKSIQQTVAEMEQRGLIRAAILQGDIDAALSHLTATYPSLLSTDPSLQFDLECAKFIELVRTCSTHATTDAPTATSTTDPAALQPVITYGRSTLVRWLHAPPNAHQALPHDYVQARLYELMPLIAYPNPALVPAVAHLLDVKAREALADRVNAGIVVHALGMPARPALEAAVRQTRAVVAEVAGRGGGEASVVDWPAGVFGGL
ncbi:concanavalin A-like lectin/glucanase domain-containing protein [Catenaria anguillulae PL171]|uniref:Concanavalin A-like lectin/glucanase domain-containing protein n=1 Tax=Catenaria anguillulae PL171 TaxID=765915 RepID=A0A1Y2HPJ7_9FUNG|nr:concanavalin A-like lectin/glucanase domain-containing protein [Catenaria anguillulae PL171]